jgi:hypothetical protein
MRLWPQQVVDYCNLPVNLLVALPYPGRFAAPVGADWHQFEFAFLGELSERMVAFD